jgi:hypothetical protein
VASQRAEVAGIHTLRPNNFEKARQIPLQVLAGQDIEQIFCKKPNLSLNTHARIQKSGCKQGRSSA